MKVLIAGGTGFLGSALRQCLAAAGHEAWVLTRQRERGPSEIRWDGITTSGWGSRVGEFDAVVHAAGYGLEHWPWSKSRKRRFIESRVLPGRALTQAIAAAPHEPAVLLQISGINYYGARGEGIADELWPAADDYLARLTVEWEASTRAVEDQGVRRVVARTAVILDAHGGLFPLMALPVRLGFGGPLGDGKQAVPWIHLEDEVNALRTLLESEAARGAFNLIAPQPTSNAEFMRAVAEALHRPYWFPTPGFLLRTALGEMSTLVVDGRYARPRRLEELDFRFRYPRVEQAVGNLFGRQSVT